MSKKHKWVNINKWVSQSRKKLIWFVSRENNFKSSNKNIIEGNFFKLSFYKYIIEVNHYFHILEKKKRWVDKIRSISQSVKDFAVFVHVTVDYTSQSFIFTSQQPWIITFFRFQQINFYYKHNQIYK